MFCQKCGKQISNESTFCTECGAPQNVTQVNQFNQTMQVHPKKKKGCLITAISIILIVIGMVAILGSSGSDKSSKTDNEGNEATITLAEFDALQTDMSYEEVVSIIGGEGTVASQSEVGGIKLVVYSWKGEGGFGANANATFQNNKLISKAQIGLE